MVLSLGGLGHFMGAIRFFSRGVVSRVLSGFVASVFLLSTVFANVAPSFAASVPRAATASAGAPAAETSPTVVEEIVASRTADSSTFRLSDGTRRALVYTGPVHYKDASGAWQDIDPTLVSTGEFGVVHTKSSAYDETVASTDATSEPVTVAHDGWTIGMRLLGASQSDLFVLGNQATYPLAMSGTRLNYTTGGDAIKDTLTLASPNAPSSFTFFVRLDNLSLCTDPLGGYVLNDAHGKPAGRMEPLSVFDSDVTTASPAGSECTSATMQVTPAPGGAYVTYDVPRSWLSDPARVFPV